MDGQTRGDAKLLAGWIVPGEKGIMKANQPEE
jgi:hypothetical protein